MAGKDWRVLWYIPNDTRPGHRGDDTVVDNHNSLASLIDQAEALEQHGWKGALIGTGWGRPDTFTIASALATNTKTFEPLIAIAPATGGLRTSPRPPRRSTISPVAALGSMSSPTRQPLRLWRQGGDQAQRYARTRIHATGP